MCKQIAEIIQVIYCSFSIRKWQVDPSILWRPAAFGDFRKKKRLNTHGFAQEFLWSGMLYRPGKSLKRRGKSSSLHSKKIFCLGVRFFLWVTSQVDF